MLKASGLLVYVMDGDYWLYELFADGEVLDQFIQDPCEAKYWFQQRGNAGNPLLLTQ